MYDAFGEPHGGSEECRPAGGGKSQAFWGFTLSGNANLQDVARFYGLDVPGLEANLTLHGYLCRRSTGSLEPGYRAGVGAADLLVLEMAEGTVKRVGLELPLAVRELPHRHRRRAAA